MAELSHSDTPDRDSEFSVPSSPLPGQPGALPELPETSAVSVPGRSSNAQLNRSAQAVGRRMGTAVNGVKNIPQQFGRLRSRIYLVDRCPVPEGYSSSLSEVAGDWRDAVEGSVSEMSEAANRYRIEFLDRANDRLRDLQHYGERKYYALRRNANARLDKVRRMSNEEPLQFIAGCAAAAFALGVALRVWRSNHE